MAVAADLRIGRLQGSDGHRSSAKVWRDCGAALPEALAGGAG
jgi:hypothetical protein